MSSMVLSLFFAVPITTPVETEQPSKSMGQAIGVRIGMLSSQHVHRVTWDDFDPTFSTCVRVRWFFRDAIEWIGRFPWQCDEPTFFVPRDCCSADAEVVSDDLLDFFVRRFIVFFEVDVSVVCHRSNN